MHAIRQQDIGSGAVEIVYSVPAELDIWGLTYLDQNRLAMLSRPMDDDDMNEKPTLWSIDMATKTAVKITSGHFYAPLYSIENGKKIICIVETP